MPLGLVNEKQVGFSDEWEKAEQPARDTGNIAAPERRQPTHHRIQVAVPAPP